MKCYLLDTAPAIFLASDLLFTVQPKYSGRPRLRQPCSASAERTTPLDSHRSCNDILFVDRNVLMKFLARVTYMAAALHELAWR